MAITLTGRRLTITDVVDVARRDASVSFDAGAERRIAASREMLERKLAGGETIYGINTGIGEFSETRLTDDEVREFQRYLVFNHAAGIGEPAPREQVRAAMVARANVHANGCSGLRPVVARSLLELLNRGVTPHVCRRGSVGASGDLAPMSQIALTVMGEGQAWVDGDLLPSADALRRVGLEPLTLEARDGLALINGANFLNGMNALCVHDVDRWLRQAEIAAAMTLAALNANLKPYDRRVHRLRGFPGAVRSAAAIMRCLEGGAVVETGGKRVQDAYSMRSTPQVIGAAHDALAFARQQVEIELNGVGDNPIFVTEDDEVLTGANFQGTPVALPMEMVGTAVTMVSVLS
jgi:histidine ammonia-lyase